MLVAILLVALNLGISYFNAWSVGSVWTETKETGGIPRFMAWMGALMSMAGFTWCYVLVVSSALYVGQVINQTQLQAAFGLGYLVVIFPIIGSGTAILVQSWATAWRTRRFSDTAVAGYNTFAEAYDIYNAVQDVPISLGWVGDLFKSDDNSDDDTIGSVIVITIVVVALLGGIITTMSIIHASARAHARTFQELLKAG